MRPLASGMADATAPEIALKGVHIVVDSAASRPQGQGRKPARHRAARFLVLLLSIVVFLPVWGLVRRSLFITPSLPAHQRQKQRDTTSTSHHTHSSRAALELQGQRALNDQQRPSSLAGSQGSLGGEIRSGSSGKISNGSLTTDSSSGSSSVDKSSASRSRKQRNPSSSQTRLHLVLSLSTSTDSKTQPATSSLPEAVAAGQENEQKGQGQVVGKQSGLQSFHVSRIPQAEQQVRLESIVSWQGETQGTLRMVSSTAGSGMGVLRASSAAPITEEVAGRSLGNRAEKTQPEDQTSSAVDGREIHLEKQAGKPGEPVNPPEQRKEQKVGEAQAAEDKGQVQKRDEQAQDQKVTPGRKEQNPGWSRRLMVLPGSDDYEAADPDQPEVLGDVAGAASAGMTTRSATSLVGARGVFSRVDVAAREAQAERRLGARTGSEGNPLAGKMGRGFGMQAGLQGQLQRTAERGNVDFEGNGRGRLSNAGVSIGSWGGAADVDQHRLIIGVTPTYQRAFQVVHITNLVNALRSVQGPFKWIVVEAPYRTEETQELLQRTAGVCWPAGQPDCRRIDYVHLETGLKERALHNKGVEQRNRALQYVQDQRLDGVVYFMDDDNIFSPGLFRELQKVRNVGVLPVGFLKTEEYSFQNPGQQHRPMVERPLVREGPGGAPEVYGWETYEWSIPTKRGGKERLFCTDMAGFAFSSKLLWSDLPGVPGFPRHPVRLEATEGGFLETTFLQKLLPNVSLLEPLASHATEVLVWHTHQEADSAFPYPTKWRLPQLAKARLVPADQEESVWPYIIGGKRHGIKGHSDKWLLPGYQLRDCGPSSLCSIRIKLQNVRNRIVLILLWARFQLTFAT